MEIQPSITELRSLVPLQTIEPIYSVQQRPWYKVYRAQMMIPQTTYSLKVTYLFTFIAFKIYVTIQVSIIPMVNTSQLQLPYYQIPLQIQNPGSYNHQNAIPIASYSYNCIYCARCNLGFSCQSHIRKGSNQFNEPK